MGRRWVFLLTVHLYYFDPTSDGGAAPPHRLLPRSATVPYLQTLELGYVALRAAPYLGPLGGLATRSHPPASASDAPRSQYWVGQTLVVARKV